MKNPIKTIIGILITGIVMAGPIRGQESDPVLRMEPDGNLFFRLYMAGLSENYSVSIKDVRDYQLYGEQVEYQTDFIRKFDLRELPDGVYFFELESSTRIQRSNLQIEDRKLSFTPTRDIAFKPFLKQRDDARVDLNYLALKGENLSVTILDKRNKVVFEEVLGGDISIQRRFNLSRLPDGTYRFCLEADGRTYFHEIELLPTYALR